MIKTKQIPMFPEHSISECGTLIINSRNRVIKQGFQVIKGKKTGYIYATMLASDYSYNKRVAVHRLVCYTWNGPPPTPEHKWVNHKDGNKANNHASNTEWTTISENIQHAYDTGLKVSKKGKEHHLFGVKRPIETKRLMSDAKKGAKHPKFKGYFFVKWAKYESANQASKATGIGAKVIAKRCKDEKFKSEGYYFVPFCEKPI